MAAPPLRDEIAALRVDLARAQKDIERLFHNWANVKQAHLSLGEERHAIASALQDLRHQSEALAKRTEDLETRLRTVSAQRVTILVALIGAVAMVAAAFFR